MAGGGTGGVDGGGLLGGGGTGVGCCGGSTAGGASPGGSPAGSGSPEAGSPSGSTGSKLEPPAPELALGAACSSPQRPGSQEGSAPERADRSGAHRFSAVPASPLDGGFVLAPGAEGEAPVELVLGELTL